jgi:hypothetical protein
MPGWSEEMSLFGVVNLFCQICGEPFRFDLDKKSGRFRHMVFGVTCSKACFDKAEIKYAHLIEGRIEP